MRTTVYLQDVRGADLGSIPPESTDVLDRLERESGWAEGASFALHGKRYTITQVHFGEGGSSPPTSRVVTAIPSGQANESKEPSVEPTKV